MSRETASAGTTPTIYDLRTDADAARFDLAVSEPGRWDVGRSARDYLLGRCFPGRSGGDPRFVVLHIQDGSTAGSLDWWVNGQDQDGNPIAASATVTVQRDGSILRVIQEADGPWTNGDVIAPTAQAAPLLQLSGNPNIWCLTLEAEGKPDDTMPPAQLAAIVWQCQEWQRCYAIPASRILPHSAINSVTRARCPGPYYARVLAELASATPGVTPVDGVAWPEGIDRALADAWFGTVTADGRTFRFDPRGPVSQAWLAEGQRTGQYPHLLAVDTLADGRRYFRFSNALTIYQAPGRPVRVLRAA